MRRLGAAVVAGLLIAGCAGEADPATSSSPSSALATVVALQEATTSSTAAVEAGSWYAVEAWPHDGVPYESANFVVFSDAAGDEARRDAADVAERVWADLLGQFEITPEMLHFPPAQDKVHIYLYKNRYPLDWGAKAYYGGLIVRSPDHLFQSSSPADYAATMKHELVHVVSNLIFGRYALWVDVWFFEGLAEAIARGSAGDAIGSRSRLDELTAEYGRTSPISIKQYSQIENPDTGEHFHYPMFQLAVEYLLDEDGLGRTPMDARDLMIDAANGIPFEEAFESRFGISLSDYEQRFFDLMDGFLGE